MNIASTRALIRTAWRDIKRNTWRSALVITMVGLPILGLTAGGALVAAAAPTHEELATGHMGNADLIVHSWDQELTAPAREHLDRAVPLGRIHHRRRRIPLHRRRRCRSLRSRARCDLRPAGRSRPRRPG